MHHHLRSFSIFFCLHTFRFRVDFVRTSKVIEGVLKRFFVRLCDQTKSKRTIGMKEMNRFYYAQLKFKTLNISEMNFRCIELNISNAFLSGYHSDFERVSEV